MTFEMGPFIKKIVLAN